MSNLIRVKAKRGSMLPHPAHVRAFVGYEVVFNDGGPVDHDVPGGSKYRMRPDGELVANTAFIRKALRRGDIEECQEPAPAPAESTTPFVDADSDDAESEA